MPQSVSIDRHVPFVRERLKGSDMVKMTVGKNDRRWSSILPKSCLRCGAYRGRRSRNASIDQHPSSVFGTGWPIKDDIDDCDLAIGDIASYLAGLIFAPLVRLRMISACVLGKGNLAHARFLGCGLVPPVGSFVVSPTCA